MMDASGSPQLESTLAELDSFTAGATLESSTAFRFERTDIAREPFEKWIAKQPKGTLLVAAAAGRPLPFEWLPAVSRPQATRPSNFGVFTWTLGETTVDLEQNDADVNIGRVVGVDLEHAGETDMHRGRVELAADGQVPYQTRGLQHAGEGDDAFLPHGVIPASAGRVWALIDSPTLIRRAGAQVPRRPWMAGSGRRFAPPSPGGRRKERGAAAERGALANSLHTVRLRQSAVRRIGRVDDAAAETFLVAIKHDRLAWGHRALRFVE
jgi:hypothetical protein